MSAREVRPGVFVVDESSSVFAGGAAVFKSGAKSSEQQPRIDLIPWEAIRREAVRMGEGAAAHGENNYRGGKHDAEFICDRINHLLRHAILYANGDRSDDHLAAIRANAGMLIWIEENQ